jgi:hypothetical protein
MRAEEQGRFAIVLCVSASYGVGGRMVSMMVRMTTGFRTIRGWSRQLISLLLALGRRELFGGIIMRSAGVQNDVVGMGACDFQSSFSSSRNVLPTAIWRVDFEG